MQCPWCASYFCSEHRLPEVHNCGRLVTGVQKVKKEKPDQFERLSDRKREAVRDNLHKMVCT